MSWQAAAACRDTDPRLFFPPTDDDTTAVVARHLAAVRPVCAGCPVASECLAWALDTGLDVGIWAATTPTDRRAIRRGRLAGVPDPVADREPACAACSLLFPVPAVDGSLCPACQEKGA